MNKLTKLFLIASSVISVGALSGCAKNNTKVADGLKFKAVDNVGESFGNVNAKVVEGLDFKFGDDESFALISPVAVQTRDGDEDTKVMRLVAGIALGDDAAYEYCVSRFKAGLMSFGFHISYTGSDELTKNLYIEVENLYTTITANGVTYRGSGELKSGEQTFKEWENACGTDYSIVEQDHYLFAALEIDGISEDYYDTIITSQAYILTYSSDDHSKYYVNKGTKVKKATANANSPYFINIDSGIGGEITTYPLKPKSDNSATKDEYYIDKLYLNENQKVSIIDSLGNTHNNFETQDGTGLRCENTPFIVPESMGYSFYYKSSKNTEGGKSDRTYIAPQKITYYFVDSSWWNQESCSTYIYLFKDGESNSAKQAWPGEKMTWVSYEDSKNTWKFTVDLYKYDTAVFSRRSGDGTADKGAQTKNVSLKSNFNTIYLYDTAAWNNDNAKANVSTVFVAR